MYRSLNRVCSRGIADEIGGERRRRKFIVHVRGHVSASSDDLLDLLTGWHRERAAAWTAETGYSTEQIKAFYLLLLGLTQTDVLSSLTTKPARVASHVDRIVDALFAARANRS